MNNRPVPSYNIPYTRQEYPSYRPQMPVYDQPQSPIKRIVHIGQMVPLGSVVPERRRILISTEGGVPRTISTVTTTPYQIHQGGQMIRRLPVGKTTVITQRPMFVETPPVANVVTVETTSSPAKMVRFERAPAGYYPSPANFNRGIEATVSADENQGQAKTATVAVKKLAETPQKAISKPVEISDKTAKPSEAQATSTKEPTSTQEKPSDDQQPSETSKDAAKTLETQPQSQKRRRKDPIKHEPEESDESEEETDDMLFKKFRIEYTDGTGGRGYQPSENEYLCPKCPAQYESRVGLTNHMKLHGTNKTHGCDLCDFSCTNKKTMRHHKRAHGILFNKRQRRSKKKLEEDRALEEQRRREVEAKRVSEMATKKPFSPVKQESAAQIVEKMNQVIANVVGADKKVEEGSKKSPEKEKSLVKKAPPKDPRAVRCPDCPFRTRTQTRLGSHQLGHSRNSGYQCGACTFKSESLSFLRRHMDLHENGDELDWPPKYVGGDPPKLSAKESELVQKLGQRTPKKEKEAPKEHPAAPVEKAEKAAPAPAQEGIASRTRHKAPVVEAPPAPELKTPRKSPRKSESETVKMASPKTRSQDAAESSKKVEERPSTSRKTPKTVSKRKPETKKGEGPFHCAQCGIKLKRYGELKIHMLHFHKANRKSPEVVRRFLRERIARTIQTK